MHAHNMALRIDSNLATLIRMIYDTVEPSHTIDLCNQATSLLQPPSGDQGGLYYVETDQATSL